MHQHYRFMIGHGAVVMLIAMFLGIGLLVKLVGGLELLPGQIISVELPGTSGAWARAHVGGLLNGILIIVAAMAAHLLCASDKARGQLRWMLVGTGYANTLFYIGALFAHNRALTLNQRYRHYRLPTGVGFHSD